MPGPNILDVQSKSGNAASAALSAFASNPANGDTIVVAYVAFVSSTHLAPTDVVRQEHHRWFRFYRDRSPQCDVLCVPGVGADRRRRQSLQRRLCLSVANRRKWRVHRRPNGARAGR